MVVDAVRQYLARFRFYGEDPFRQVSSLSGGEKTRLALARLLLVPRNFLLLDEPTNHLDIPACEILEEALASFEGTVILVSHDRYFLSRVCTRVLHLEGAEATFYPAGYDDYEARRRALAAPEKPAVTGSLPPVKTKAPAAAVDTKTTRESHEERRKRQREQEKRARRIKELDGLVRAGETRLAELRASLAGDPGGDWARIAKWAEEEQELARKIDLWSEEWLTLSEEN
jgi:ATP-binding cassette subfamily F protein 3